jgi:hypothetical protein
MRLKPMIVASLLLAQMAAFPHAAGAAEAAAAAAAPPPAEESLPDIPEVRPEPGVSGYHIMVIAAGTVAAIVAANFLSGGLITPVLTFGLPSTPEAAAAAAAGLTVNYNLQAARAAVVLGAAAAGAYLANVIYSK